MPADEDAQPGAGPAARLLGELQGEAARGHDVAAADHARFFQAENLAEIHAAQGHNGRGGIRGGAR